jgi:hypothetical protein
MNIASEHREGSQGHEKYESTKHALSVSRALAPALLPGRLRVQDKCTKN